MKARLPTRVVIGINLFLACAICYMVRVSISINLITMVDPIKTKSASSHVAECAAITNNTSNNDTNSTEDLTKATDYGPRYDWDSKIQGLILGAYFYGYILTSMPGGLIAEYFGTRHTIGISTLLTGVVNILIPLGASWHYGFVIAFRAILGLLGGVVYPALHCLISKWAPPAEKGTFVACLMGGTMGTVLTWPLLAVVIENFGWYWSYFIPGIICIGWCISWYLLVFNTPDEHPRISEDEKLYISKATAGSVQKTKSLPPYKSIFTSLAFWALAISHFGNVWGLYLLLTGAPKFMSEVLGFNLQNSGILASLPYLARLIFSFIFGAIGDYLRKNDIMSVTAIRKTFMIFSHFLPGVFLFAQTFVGCDSVLAVTFITLSLGMNGASSITNLQNSQDLAPNFAGTLYGLINCIGGITGIITPLITGVLTEENNGLKEWRIIFIIGAAVYIGCGVVYIMFGTGNEQSWNKIKEKDEPADGIENPAFENGTIRKTDDSN